MTIVALVVGVFSGPKGKSGGTSCRPQARRVRVEENEEVCAGEPVEYDGERHAAARTILGAIVGILSKLGHHGRALRTIVFGIFPWHIDWQSASDALVLLVPHLLLPLLLLVHFLSVDFILLRHLCKQEL